MGLFEHFKNKAPSPTDDVVRELQALTTDDDSELVVLRALGIYRTIVPHVKAGGTVKFNHWELLKDDPFDDDE